MSKPQGDRILDYDPAELWAKAVAPKNSERSEQYAFRQLIQQIPQEKRDALQAMYGLEYQARTDGGLGYGVVDFLWIVYRDTMIAKNREPGTTQAIAERLGLSVSYVHALRSALEIND